MSQGAQPQLCTCRNPTEHLPKTLNTPQLYGREGAPTSTPPAKTTSDGRRLRSGWLGEALGPEEEGGHARRKGRRGEPDSDPKGERRATASGRPSPLPAASRGVRAPAPGEPDSELAQERRRIAVHQHGLVGDRGGDDRLAQVHRSAAACQPSSSTNVSSQRRLGTMTLPQRGQRGTSSLGTRMSRWSRTMRRTRSSLS